MTDLMVVPQTNQWLKLKSLVLDSVSSPITKRVYNLGLDEFFAWFGLEPRAGFTKATVSAWRVALEARGLGAVSTNVRITGLLRSLERMSESSWPSAMTERGVHSTARLSNRRLCTGRRPPERARCNSEGARNRTQADQRWWSYREAVRGGAPLLSQPR